jgi:hypothetical protein
MGRFTHALSGSLSHSGGAARGNSASWPSEYAWTVWSFAWGTPASGEHTVTSRATAVNGEVQPAPDEPPLAGKQPYWESNGPITWRVRLPEPA